MSGIDNIKEKLQRIDIVLPTLIFWEMIYLIAGQAIIWILLPVNKPSVALGFLIGVGLASFSSIMTSLIMKKVFSKKRGTSARLVLALIARLAVAGGFVALALYTGFCDPIAILIGMLSMQLGVYFEPGARRKREEQEIAKAKADGTYKAPQYKDLTAAEIKTDADNAEVAGAEEAGDAGREKETEPQERPSVVNVKRIDGSGYIRDRVNKLKEDTGDEEP